MSVFNPSWNHGIDWLEVLYILDTDLIIFMLRGLKTQPASVPVVISRWIWSHAVRRPAKQATCGSLGGHSL